MRASFSADMAVLIRLSIVKNSVLPFGYSCLHTGLAVVPESVTLETVPAANANVVCLLVSERDWLWSDSLPPPLRI